MRENLNAVYRLQISALVPEILKFKKMWLGNETYAGQDRAIIRFNHPLYLCTLLRRYGLCFAMRIAKAKLGLLGRELI